MKWPYSRPQKLHSASTVWNFARARISREAGSFRSGQEIVLGVGAEERVLEERNAAAFRDLVTRLRSAPGPQGARHQALWRLHPERWLESLVIRDVSTVDGRLDHSCLYSQAPAFSASDRAMLDVRPRPARVAWRSWSSKPMRISTLRF